MVSWGRLGSVRDRDMVGSEHVRWTIFEQVRPSATCPEATVTHCQSINHRFYSYSLYTDLMKHA